MSTTDSTLYAPHSFFGGHRDRNHPGVVVWILGNDLPDAGTVIGVGTAAPMATRVCQLDTTRPLTTAIFGWNGGMSWKWEAADPPEEVTQLT